MSGDFLSLKMYPSPNSNKPKKLWAVNYDKHLRDNPED